MARIVIVSASEASRTQLHRLLASSGYAVYRLCASDGELRRTLSECEDGIVLIAGNVPDGLPDVLVQDYADSYQFLLVARPEALAACESREVFKLAFPCAGSAVIGAIEILTQLHYMRLPSRTGEEKTLVDRAKGILMRRLHIGEPEAHRHMQRYAMRHGMKMTEYALAIIQGGTDDARSVLPTLSPGDGA